MNSAIKQGNIMTEKPLAPANPNLLKRYAPRLGRVSATLLLLFMTAQAASAYTLVMRSGRRVQIPDAFNVTRTTLSYEAAPGISVTLQMSTIDIAATERINNEPAGSLLRRAAVRQSSRENSASSAVPSTPRRALRTITNRDLEASRRARAESEEAYERRRKALGLPSLDEMRRRNEEETRRLAERARSHDEEESQSELYWRERATELRTEAAVVDAQIDYLRNQLARSQGSLTISSFSIVTGVGPRFPFRPRGARLPFATRWPQPLGATDTGARAVAVTGSAGSTRGQVLASTPGPVFNNFGGHRVFRGRRAPSFPFGLYAQSFPVYDSGAEYSVLVARLRELESIRAGLEARWRLLEDEARRAGAPPGWLRP